MAMKGINETIMKRFCATRTLKNAKAIRKAASHIIPAKEPLEGFKSLVPLNILRRFHRMSEAELAKFPELLKVQQGLHSPPVKPSRPALFGDSPFKGTLHFVRLTFFIEANNSTISVSRSDVAIAVKYATLAINPISAYASQYGSNRLEVSPDILEFGIAVTGGFFNDDAVQNMVNSILDQNHLDSDSSCIVMLNPQGMINTDADPADGVGGYHDKAHSPYCFVNLSGTGLTVQDKQDFYADALSHEIAEMTCDPDVSIFNDEVCDGCAGNCKNPWRNFFVDPSPSLANSYLGSANAPFPPPFPFTYFIASIATREHADDCPAPDGACAYGPPIHVGFTVDPGTAVAALSRSQDHIDLFVVGRDGAVYSTYWDANGGWPNNWFRLGDDFAVNPGTAVTALLRSQDHIDLFVVGRDRAIYSTYWDANSGWGSSWFRIREGVAEVGSPITAVARDPDHLDLFITGTDGGIYSIYWDDASGWGSSWFRIREAVAELGSPITAVARDPDHLDLFVTGTDGGIYSIYWDANSGWGSSWFRIREAVAKVGSPVTAVARTPDHLDLFVTGTDGGIYSIYWDANSGWGSSWFRIREGVAEVGSPITAVARDPDHLDLFVTGTDGGIYSIYWDANSGWPNSWFTL
jgi:hypothetical protein